ncbi:hypothetical protein [Clostridium hydrogeniformans]|uniref:hypothetical protein n=1 Tax=Clostridium hydrogeniformans TaxID=349933 RepID=UPI000487D8F2|nr:hypothetical protein [Clostridium hydrogeniformans]
MFCWILTGVGILFIIFVMVGWIVVKNQEKKRYGNVGIYSVTYAGGWNRLSEGVSMKFVVYDNKVLIETNNSIYKLEINYNRLKDIYFKSEKEIKEDITLSRIVMLELFDWGVKKKKEYIRNFLIVEYLDADDKECIIIFAPIFPLLNKKLLTDLHSKLDKFKVY